MQKAFDGEYDIYGSTIIDKELKEISNLGIKVKNPIDFVMEVEENGRNN